MELVSIYIVTLNRLSFLKRAVISVLNQTYSNIELIIVDNGSTDGTVEYLLDVECDERVKVIFLNKNMGACYARNKAILMASGKYVTGLDDDDHFTDIRIESLLSVYLKGMCSLAFSDDYFSESLDIRFKSNRPSVVSAEMIAFQNFIGNQVLTEKRIFLSAGLFDEDLKAAQDYDMWFRIIKMFGPAKKANNAMQYIEISNHTRISTSRAKFFGYMQFYHKHKSMFTRGQRKHQLLNIKYSCNNNVSLKIFLILFDFNVFNRKVKIFINKVIFSRGFKH